MQGVLDNAYSQPLATSTERKLAREVAGRWVGPMPVPVFFDTFLPMPDAPRYPKPAKAAKWKNYFSLTKFPECRSQPDMYDHVMKIITGSEALSSLKVVDTSTHPDVESYSGMKNYPDLTLYWKDLDTRTRPTQFEEAELILEIKTMLSDDVEAVDPFEDSPDSATASTPAGTSITSTSAASGTTKADSGGSNLDPTLAPPVYTFEPSEEQRMRCRGQLAGYARIVFRIL